MVVMVTMTLFLVLWGWLFQCRLIWEHLQCSIPQMHIDSHEALGVLNTLFEILAPSSLRPVDMLLRSMFVTPDTLVSLSQYPELQRAPVDRATTEDVARVSQGYVGEAVV